MTRALLLLVALSLLGCGHHECVMTVRIVAVQCEHRSGAPDCVTVLEDAHGFRYTFGEKLGDVGDKFQVRRENGWRVLYGAGEVALEPCPCVLPEKTP